MSHVRLPLLRPRDVVAAALCCFLLTPALASAAPCVVPGASGTVSMPPPSPPCPYTSPTDFHLITGGLPIGTTIIVGVEHERFINVTHNPDPAGGELETFNSTLRLTMQGTGTLAGYNHVVMLPAACESHVDAHTPFDPVQSFDTEMRMIQGQTTGDPDFDLLRITAGSAFGMPSPGHTTLTKLPGGGWNVDSFFDISYQIDFVGKPGGVLGGMSGSTTGTIRMGTGDPVSPPVPACTVVNDGSGTVALPPPGCGYVSPEDLHMMIAGLPPGTEITVAAEHRQFSNITTTPGGSLGGEVEQYQSALSLNLNGTGDLAGFSRNLTMQALCETHVGPRTPGVHLQSFDTDMFRIAGELPIGDPDFDLLRISAGTGFGLPSPGHTTLTRLPDNNWNIDSFFDITYRIDFVGRPGGALSGMSGSTTGTIRMTNGHPVPAPWEPCTVVDNGSGTVNLPPQGCGYVSPNDLHKMINGLPPGVTIQVGVQHRDFFNVVRQPGGSLGGEIEQFNSGVLLNLTETGGSAPYQRPVSMQAQCETHVAPRTPGQPVQSFDTQMFRLLGNVGAGDPDFDLLRITAGAGFGMPSPGHTTLTKQPGTPNWAVDSYFDISYRIDFTGRAGGRYGGMSGSTTGTIRMATGSGVTDVPDQVQPKTLKLSNLPNPFGSGTTIQYRLPSAVHVTLKVFDAAGKLVRSLTNEQMPAGPHAQMWDGRNDDGRRVRPGAYFIKLALAGKTVGTAKATLIR